MQHTNESQPDVHNQQENDQKQQPFTACVVTSHSGLLENMFEERITPQCPDLHANIECHHCWCLGYALNVLLRNCFWVFENCGR